MPTYLELTHEGNYIATLSGLEVWELNGEIYSVDTRDFSVRLEQDGVVNTLLREGTV